MLYFWFFADLLLVLLISFLGYRSMKKGFLKSSYRGVSSLISLVLVMAIGAPFQGMLEQSSLGDFFYAEISEKVQSSANLENTNDTTAVDVIEGLQLPHFITDYLKTSVEKQEESFNHFKDNLLNGITNMLFSLAMQIISVILLFILIKIALTIIFFIMKQFVKNPIFSVIDKGLGAVIGGINALLIIFIVCALMIVFVPADSVQNIEAGVNTTLLFKYFYYNNLIINLLF